MRVLVVHNRYRSAEPSGENTVVEQETRLLAAAGIDVERCLVESDAIATWPLRRRLAVPAGVVWSRSGQQMVRRAIDATQPDVVHFHNTFPLLSPAAIRAASSRGVATVQTFHNFRPICPSSNGLLRDGHICHDCPGRLPLSAVRHGCYRGSPVATLPLAAMDVLHERLGTWTRHLDRLIFPSSFALDEYRAAGWPTDRMVIKPNTAERPAAADHGERAGLACIARMRDEKGLDVLIEAWRRAEAASESLRLIGDGEQLDEYRKQAADLPGIRFEGQIPFGEIEAALVSAAALVVPSKVPEVFPRVVLEAFAVGTPVLAARRGVLADLVRDGENGLLFEPDDVADLARAITQALADPAALRRMGETALADYEALYSPEVTTRRLIEIYQEAIEHRRNPRVG
jgi:glycosyltransferase involved in cell wall biosynthesis